MSEKKTETVLLLKEGCGNCQYVRVWTPDACEIPYIYTVKVPRWLGLGDMVKDLIYCTTRIRPCGGCRRRQSWLNKRFPWHKEILDLLPDYVWYDLSFPCVVEVDADKLEKAIKTERLYRAPCKYKLHTYEKERP